MNIWNYLIKDRSKFCMGVSNLPRPRNQYWFWWMSFLEIRKKIVVFGLKFVGELLAFGLKTDSKYADFDFYIDVSDDTILLGVKSFNYKME